MSNSSAAAQQIARTLVAAAVTDVVLAPGSRSAPLVYALAPLAEAGLIRTHVRIDERDAGFLALGLARGLRTRDATAAADAPPASGVVALVTTSGSAVANLHPAILEASYGHLPLIAITADRPARLRGTGANQTLDDQSAVLTDVRARFDVPAGAEAAVIEKLLAAAVARSSGVVGGQGEEAAGPVQFNAQFDAPLVPTAAELAAWSAEIADEFTVSARAVTQQQAKDRPRVPVDITDGTVIVAGDAGGRSGSSLLALAERFSLPVLAEPSSPLAHGRSSAVTLVPAHARVLAERSELRGAIRTVIVHGKPTLTRPVSVLLADEHVCVQRLPDDVDALELVPTAGPCAPTPEGGASTAWARDWVAAGQEIVTAARAQRESDGAQDSTVGVFEHLARTVTERLAMMPITLFAASSNSVRYLSEATHLRARIHASRGLAGIDGLVSTATGLSLGLTEPVVLLIGDVAMLHDIGGLLTPSAEARGDVTIVVLNDDGGAIFSGLEHSQNQVEQYLQRYFTVPHGRGFAEFASAYDWDYARVGDLCEFDSVIGCDPEPGVHSGPGTRRIIEVRLD